MSTLFAAQLNEIAKTSTDELNLKAQKAAHSQSLIFEKKAAGSQDFATIFQICLEGFEDLCRLDARFVPFSHNIFSPQSRTQERGQMTKEQNAELDVVLESFLGLLGAKLLLRPAIKAVDWLIRRFRVNEYNTAFLLFTFLPYHETPIFQNLLSILPDAIPPSFKFLSPYLRSFTFPPRHVIVYSATSNDGFFTAFNNYTLRLCQNDSQHQQLLTFWAAVCVEAVSERLHLAKSGRQDIERQREEDVLIKVLPVLNDGLSLSNSVELTLACYTISIVLTAKAKLADKVLDRLIEAVVGSFNPSTNTAGMICLAIISKQRQDLSLPRKIVSVIQKLPRIYQLLREIGARYDIAPLTQGLITNCMSTLGRKNPERKIEFVHCLLENNCVPQDALPEVIGVVLQAVAATAHGSDEQLSYYELICYLIKMLRDQEPFSEAFQKALLDSQIDIDHLEANLQMTIDTEKRLPTKPNIDMKDGFDPTAEDVFSTALSHLPEHTEETSFLSAGKSHLFEQLSGLFKVAIHYKQTMEMFQNLPLLQREAAPGNFLYISFFCRTLMQDHVEAVRVAAAESIASTLISQNSPDSMQAVLPYTLLALADPVARVRRAASQIILLMSNLESNNSRTPTESPELSGLTLYGHGDQKEGIVRLSSHDFFRMLRKIILPVLEECVLDSDQIKRALESALKGSSSTTRVNASVESIDIKKGLRSSLFEFLVGHIFYVPLYSVKLKLLQLLSNVHKVGSRYKSDELLPLLHDWASKPATRVQDIAEAEKVRPTAIDNQMAQILSPGEQQPVKKMLSLFELDDRIREAFVNAMYNHLVLMWPLLRHEAQAVASQLFFDEALSLDKKKENVSRFCRDVLRAVNIPSETLSACLEEISDSAMDHQGGSPPSKKRRIGHQQQPTNSVKDSHETVAYVQRLAFILEILDGSEPEHRPDILRALFKALGAAHHLKTRLESGMGYVLNLALGSILAIVRHAKYLSALHLDPSAIRIDLIINCVRLSEDHQVQSTALLAIANIARLAPDTVLHSVMPIFTFIGSNMSRKDDEYSAHVIDQTIDHVIPPLIRSLKEQKRDVLAGASELLSHFTAAFEHMPSHRRARLFEILITRLGPSDFLFAALAMLATRSVEVTEQSTFITTLATKFSLDIQLISCQKLLALISDTLANEPKEAQTILNVNQMTAEDRHRTVYAMIQSLSSLFNRRGLGSPMDKSLRSASATASDTREALATILEQLIHLGTLVPDQDNLSEAVTAAIDLLLELPPLHELISITIGLLSHEDDKLRQKTLRLVEKRLATENSINTATQSAAIEFLQTLIGVVASSPDALLRLAAITCVDRITEKYGRKDSESILQCAYVVAGATCLDSTDERLGVVSLLCVSTMIETCKEAMIPILPEALPHTFKQIRHSITENKESARLHNAGFSVLLSIVSNLPWIISEDDIGSMLCLSAESAELDVGDGSEELRKEVLLAMADKFDLCNSLLAFRRSWSTIASYGINAISESAVFLSNIIESHPKNVVVGNSELLLDLFMLTFDLRRFHLSETTDDSYSEEEIDRFEAEMREVFLKMVYKLNDSSFRPLFQRLVEWSTQAPNSAEPTGIGREKVYRQTSLFKLLAHFFATLKSIVTSFAGFVLPSAVEVLEDTLASSDASDDTVPANHHHTLWLSALSMLLTLLEHDSDAYFSTPSLFTPLSGALVSQLKLSFRLPFARHITTHVILCIVSLAQAVASTTSHHQSLNSAICALRRDKRKEIRLASVRCQAALTEALAEEWLENVSAEMMVYINEMLEDEDEEVEGEVRRWVGKVQEVLGEEIGV